MVLNCINPGMFDILSSCHCVEKCGNNQCFFRQRDHFGLSPWAVARAMPDQKQIAESLLEKYGETIFPKLEASIGTNCVYVRCLNYKVGEPCGESSSGATADTSVPSS